MPFDLRGLRQWFRVAPGYILDGGPVYLRRPVRGLALVRAVRHALAGDEQVRIHVLGRDIVAGRQAGLKEYLRPDALGVGCAVDGYLYVPGASAHVYPMVGSRGWTEISSSSSNH